MPPIKLTDSELTHIFEAARPIPVNRRDDFLQEVARLLRGCIEVGPGTVHRACVEAQSRFFDPPDFDRAVPRWSRKDGGIRRAAAET
jgi:hypothetical protein